MPEIYTSLGSNQDREKNIQSAVREMRRRYGQLRLSTVYQNAAVGFDGDDFLNMVVGFDSDETPASLQAQFREIEDMHGRTRDEKKFAPRPLDIDLILYGDQVSHEPGLELPRSDILEYAFVLLPLTQLLPEGVHPGMSRRYEELWQEFKGNREMQPVELQFD
jgi:2-amino-4-hydroxy-6-hydroxymethyldihydropteridine diphosphokinase